MAGNMKDVKNRIKSIESTKQITKAMELVAFSKLRKAKQRAEQSRPFFNKLYETMSDIAAMNTDFSSIYTKKVTGKEKPLYIVIAGDRGLAGGYNTNVYKYVARETEKNEDVKVITFGKKATEFYKKKPKFEVIDSHINVSEDFSTKEAREICDFILDKFEDGEFNSVYIVFTQFLSALQQEPTMLKMLPLDFGGVDETNKQMMELVEYEPSPEEVFEQIIPMYMMGILYGGVVESFASEQASRRNSMESATDNAEEMISNLNLVYNRARQGAITQELTEIVAGSSANS